MRIAFVIYGDLSLTSGGFLYDRKVVEGLRTLGDEVDVIALPWPSYLRGLLENRKPVAFPRSLRSYDVIVEDELIHPSMIVRNHVLRRAGVPLVSLVHNLTCEQPATRHKPIKSALEASYLRSIDGLVAVCKSTLESSLSRAHPGLIHAVAYPGRDHIRSEMNEPAVHMRAVKSGPLRVLCLAQVAPHKGAHRLLRALQDVPRDIPIELVLVGALENNPDYVAALRWATRSLGTHVRVIFRGELFGEALQHELEHAHVMALASDREAYPISCLEGLSYGLAVLLTNQGGTRELIRHEREGFLLHPHDLRAWTRALVSLGRDRARLAVMGTEAMARAAAHGTWRETAAVLRGVCEQVAKRPRRARFYGCAS